MPSLTTWPPFCTVVLPMWTMLSPWSKQSHGCSCQGCKATNHTGTLQNLPTGLFGTVRNLPNPASGTYTNPRGTLQNPPEPTVRPTSGTSRQHTPEPSKILRNLPKLASGTYTILHRNLPEPASGTYTSTRWNSPEPSRTFRNRPEPPPQPTPATRTGTHRSLSGLKTPLAYAVGEKYKMSNYKPVADGQFSIVVFVQSREQLLALLGGQAFSTTSQLSKHTDELLFWELPISISIKALERSFQLICSICIEVQCLAVGKYKTEKRLGWLPTCTFC